VLATVVGCYLLKLAGYSLPPRVHEHPVVRRVADLLPVALLAALIGVQTFTSGHHIVIDARAAGVGAAAVAILLRAPFVVVVVLAAAVTAGVRAL
jgi:branched-subunit amino acid transport protein